MGSFYDDDKSRASSEDDEDEEMEDLDGGDGDAGQDPEPELDNEEDNGDGFDDDDQDDNHDLDDSPSRSLPRRQGAAADSNATTDQRRQPPHADFRTTNGQRSATHSRGASVSEALSPFRPSLRPEAVTASMYDIVPTIAAPHSTSINSITATPDMRWVFSGGSDGWVRKFNWVDTLNARSMLTVAQRHPFVDSVQKAGVLVGYWENEDGRGRGSFIQNTDENPSLSPVYSLAVQHQALWLLSGTESGVINLHAVRHDEGKRITSLHKHTSAVSVMSLARDEASFLSGSWDKSIHDWDLETGQIKRSFLGSGGQISAIEMRPLSDVPVPHDTAEPVTASTTFASNNAAEQNKPSGGDLASSTADNARRRPEIGAGSPADSLFGDSLFGDGDNPANQGVGFDQDDEDNDFSRAFAGGVDQQPEAVNSGMEDDLGVGNDTSMTNGDVEAPPATGVDGAAMSTTNILDDVFARDGELEARSAKRDETPAPDAVPMSEAVFLDAAIDGTLRIWDRRQPGPIARIAPARGTPPWCMHACWSHDGNHIYAGRRNGTVDEYSLHKSLQSPARTLHFPAGSGPVSAVRAMPNSKHLICASYDILRLYDLKDEENAKKSTVPFLIVPGHRTGVVSQLHLDPTCAYMISTGGNRGWEGGSTEVLLGYEIGHLK